MKKLKAKLNAKKRKGFTIVELIVVMAIIAILTLIAVPTFSKFIDDANDTATDANAKTLYNLAMSEALDASINNPAAPFTVIQNNLQEDANIPDATIIVTPYTTAPTDAELLDLDTADWNVYIKATDTATVDDSGDIYIISPTDEGGQVYLNGMPK